MNETDTATRRFAVMGHPIAHSKSPWIHARFAEQFGLQMDYTAIDVMPGTFIQAARTFQKLGGKGLNITVPYKLEAWELVDQRSARAELAGAVNTIRFEEDGSLYGDNSDGQGLLNDLLGNLGITLARQRLLLLGAGGAVRGVLGPLLGQQPAECVIANRTIARAEDLAQLFAGLGDIEPCGFAELAGRRFDVVINGTAASLAGEVPPLPEELFRPGALAYDMMYADRPTAFMQWARQHGAERVCDGLGMLVEQAAESFFIWWDKRPETGPVIAVLREAA